MAKDQECLSLCFLNGKEGRDFKPTLVNLLPGLGRAFRINYTQMVCVHWQERLEL